jgi:hypothetical protein
MDTPEIYFLQFMSLDFRGGPLSRTCIAIPVNEHPEAGKNCDAGNQQDQHTSEQSALTLRASSMRRCGALHAALSEESSRGEETSHEFGRHGFHQGNFTLWRSAGAQKHRTTGIP